MLKNINISYHTNYVIAIKGKYCFIIIAYSFNIIECCYNFAIQVIFRLYFYFKIYANNTNRS